MLFVLYRPILVNRTAGGWLDGHLIVEPEPWSLDYDTRLIASFQLDGAGVFDATGLELLVVPRDTALLRFSRLDAWNGSLQRRGAGHTNLLVALVRSAGGVTSLAHPSADLTLSGLATLRDLGLQAVVRRKRSPPVNVKFSGCHTRSRYARSSGCSAGGSPDV